VISCVDGEKRGGQHEVIATREIADVGAVLVHDGQALDATLCRPGLVDEHDAAVEIALLAGKPLIDRVGDDVGDTPPIVRRREILLPGELAGRRPRPRAETRP
jgi:hypothetical protein